MKKVLCCFVSIFVLLSTGLIYVEAADTVKKNIDNPLYVAEDEYGADCNVAISPVEHITGSHSYSGKESVIFAYFRGDSSGARYNVTLIIDNAIIDFLDSARDTLWGTESGYVDTEGLEITYTTQSCSRDLYIYYSGKSSSSSVTITRVEQVWY